VQLWNQVADVILYTCQTIRKTTNGW